MDAFVILTVIALALLAVAIFHQRMQRRRLKRALTHSDMGTLHDMGWRVESTTAHHIHIVNGRRVNHILHLLLTVFTAGLWGIVWVYLALNGGEKRRSIAK